MTTIFAPITATFHGSIIVVRISGAQTKNCLKALGITEELQHQKISLQKIFDPATNKILDEVLISFFQAPRSFTGEDIAEISIHASPFILKKLLQILSKQKNCRLAEAGEFSKRAFLNGKMDLTRAEAIPDLIAAETDLQHRQALQQLEGKLGEIYENWRVKLIEISALLAAAIDFPDEDLPQNIIDNLEESVQNLQNEIKNHLQNYHIAQKIKDGLSLAIIGAPNVGKSSLLNFLAKSDVAIVSDIAGTTRDVIDIHLSIGGFAVKISDTAGIRNSNDQIEVEGIKRALKKAQNADLKILMIDAKNPVFDESLIDEKTIIVINKTDLATVDNFKLPALKISLKENQNTDALLQKLQEEITKIIPSQNSPLITQERYFTLLTNCLHNLENFSLKNNIELAAEDLRMAAREIGKIIGQVDVDDILNVIFSRFCIGK